MSTYTPISTQTTTSVVTAVTFTNIPQSYTDLVLVCSASNDVTDRNLQLRFNASSSGYSAVRLFGYSAGSEANFYTNQTVMQIGINSGTSDAFSTHIINIQNYSNTTTAKSVVSRTADHSAYSDTYTGTWNNTSAITSIEVSPASANFRIGSVFTLYGIEAGTAKAVGGEVIITGGYAYHTFKGSGTFTALDNITAEILVIGGGGGADNARSGGGGAGGLVYLSSQSLTSQTTYAVTVGAGGTTRTSSDSVYPTSGSNSQFGSLTAAVGGGAGGLYRDTAANGLSGGSGGGGSVGANTGQGTGGSPTSGQGYAGGASINKTNAAGGWTAGGGGGGAGAAGADGTGNGANNTTNTPGAGGAGLSTYSAWGLATNTGHNVSGTVWYAGGGGSIGINSSGVNIISSPGNGNGGSNTVAPTATTGGGGSAGSAGTGASGVVIVRYTI